jgi:hypothetical protein
MQGSEKIQDPQCVAQMRGLDFSLTSRLPFFDGLPAQIHMAIEALRFPFSR